MNTPAVIATNLTDTMKKDAPRLAISLGVVIAFTYAVGWHWSAGLEQTLTNIAMIVVGYWFGSSKGSSDKNDQITELSTTGAEK
jgi:uncharacterized membrane protein AbrB (regulator of aidB expression)